MSKDGEGQYTAGLKAVPESDITNAVDSWAMPTDLPEDVLMSPRRFCGERFWRFNPEEVRLIPIPALPIKVTILEYLDYPVLLHNHRKWLLNNQEQIPEDWRPYQIYFIGDTYLRHREERSAENIRHVYRIVYRGDKWVEEEYGLNAVPGYLNNPQKAEEEKEKRAPCRLIMMR